MIYSGGLEPESKFTISKILEAIEGSFHSGSSAIVTGLLIHSRSPRYARVLYEVKLDRIRSIKPGQNAFGGSGTIKGKECQQSLISRACGPTSIPLWRSFIEPMAAPFAKGSRSHVWFRKSGKSKFTIVGVISTLAHLFKEPRGSPPSLNCQDTSLF